ncbi:hypothetical protein A2U01_0106411, partial [Trifolium medium]|nr:hypothetical protein [Trifolium medium]
VDLMAMGQRVVRPCSGQICEHSRSEMMIPAVLSE